MFFLSLACVDISASEPFDGQEDTTGIKMQYSIEEVKITASGLFSLNQQMERILSAFESNEIELAPAGNLQDILEYYISADIRSRGAEGVQADAAIRGGTFDQTLILLNGVNISDPQTGHHSLNLPVSLNQVERIEFLNGRAAASYSPAAFSGAINIITKEPDENSAALYAVLGSFGYSDFEVNGNFKTGEAAHLISGSLKKSDGYIDNTDFHISSVYYSNNIKSDKGRMNWQAGLSEKAFGANSFYSPEYPDQFEEIGSSFISGRWSSSGRLHFTPVIYYRRNADKFMLFRGNAPDWYRDHNYHRTDTWGGNMSAWLLWPAGKTTFGTEYRSENILSSLLGEPSDKLVPVSGEDAYYTNSDSRSKLSAHIEHACFFSDWILTAGGILSYISGSTAGLYFLPGMEIRIPAGSSLRAGLSWQRAMRLPTFTDLYYSGPVNIGNPLLKPEYSNTLDGELKINKKYLKGHIGLFYRIGRNMIDWIRYDTGELWQSQNLTEVRSYGAELQVELDLNKLLEGAGPDNMRLGYYFNDQFKGESDFISYYVLDYLKHKFIVSVTHNITPNVSINVRCNFQDRAGTYSAYINNGISVEKSYLPFWLFDSKAMYQNKCIKFFVSVNNIFNKRYFDLGNIMQPGIWIKGGFSYKFNFN
jgi:iron complex outermembrane receptor protein